MSLGRGWVWNGKQMLQKSLFPTHPALERARCWQLHISVWTWINVKNTEHISGMRASDGGADRQRKESRTQQKWDQTNAKQHLMSRHHPATSPPLRFPTGLNSNTFIPTLHLPSDIHQRVFVFAFSASMPAEQVPLRSAKSWDTMKRDVPKC